MREIRRVLCPIDFSEFSMRSYRYALSIASHYRATLFVQHVIELWRYPYADFAASVASLDEFYRKLREGGEEQLQKFLKTCAHEEVQPEHVVQQGMAPDCILQLAEARQVDLIVMGTHGRRGFDRLMIGSVTERVMRRASCPVLAVNKPSHDFIDSNQRPGAVHLNRILFCTDFSENSQRALDHAISLTAEYGAELTLLHVLEDTPASARIEQEMAAVTAQLEKLIPPEARKTGKFKIKPAVRIGKAYQQIIQLALEAQTDLIAMAVRGRGALDLAVFGSTTHRVMQFGSCPVLVVHV